MASFSINEENQIIRMYFSRERDQNGQLPTFALVARQFNEANQKRIRGRDVQRLIERLEQNGVCQIRHRRAKRVEVVSREILDRVNNYYMQNEDWNDSLRVTARRLGIHFTTVYR